jgi:hypothetical protein
MRNQVPTNSHQSMAGYTATPLWKKLGYKTGARALADRAPPGYPKLLELPSEVAVTWLTRAEKDMGFVHVFTKEAAALRKKLAALRRQIALDGVIWVSWHKQSSGVGTDITEDTIRVIALPLGLVCAVDETWSGLKLMIRKTGR